MRIEKGKREIMSTGCSGEAALYRFVVGHSPYKRDHSSDGSFVSNQAYAGAGRGPGR